MKRVQWSELVIILILTLLPFLFFWRLITPNPADRMNIAAGDFTEQYFPLRAFSAQEWVRGQIPLWNPYLYGGQPALADIQSGALYPIHIAESLLLGWGGPVLGREIGFPLKALELQVIIHFSLAAVGTYLFARHIHHRHGTPLRRARFGGVIASLVFTYSGYLTGFPVQQLTILQVSAWLPWVLWGLDAALSIERLEIRKLNPVAWGALAFAMSILAGHPQTVMYIFYLSLAYTIFCSMTKPCLEQNAYRAKSRCRRNQSPITTRRLFQTLTTWVIIILLGTALSAAQLLPTLEFISRSVRAELTYQAVSAGLPLSELVTILYPGFFGGSPAYVGIAPLVLIALALVLGKPRAVVFFWAGAGLVSLLLAFGNNLFAYPLAYLLAPGFDAVRQQERIFLIYSFSAAMLAGFGAVAIAGSLSKSSRLSYTQFQKALRVVVVLAFFLTGFYIYGATAASVRGDEVNLFFGVLRHHIFGLIFLAGMLVLLALRSQRRLSRWWGISLIAIWIAFNLFTVNWQFNLEKRDEPNPFVPDGATAFLQSKLQSKIQNPKSKIIGRISSGGHLPGGNSAASVFNLEDLTGNTPLQLVAVGEFFVQMPAWRLWQLMNVRHIVDQRDISDPGLRLVFAEDELKVFEMADPFARAWFVSQVEVIANQQMAIQRMASDNFDLRRAAVVAEPLPVDPDNTSASDVTVVAAGPPRLQIETNSASQSLLVVSQIYYPGWQVTIDAQPAELLRVNAVQQGIIVPAGQHLIELTYWPNSFAIGLVISGSALLLCGIVWLGRTILS